MNTVDVGEVQYEIAQYDTDTVGDIVVEICNPERIIGRALIEAGSARSPLGTSIPDPMAEEFNDRIVDKLTVTPKDGKNTIVQFLIRTVENQKNKVSFKKAEPIDNNPLEEEQPSEFSEQEFEYITEEEVVECYYCNGTGKKCSECSSDPTEDKKERGATKCTEPNCSRGTYKPDCPECNGVDSWECSNPQCVSGKIDKGQCSVCCGNPPIGLPGKIECTTCDAGDDIGQCGYCDGKGKRKIQSKQIAKYSIVTKNRITGDESVKQNAEDIIWQKLESYVIEDTKEIASLPVIQPSESVIRTRVLEVMPLLYSITLPLDDGEFQALATDDNTLETQNIYGKKRNFLGRLSKSEYKFSDSENH